MSNYFEANGSNRRKIVISVVLLLINIFMNTSPVFSDGKTEGNLMIVNELVNSYPLLLKTRRTTL